jgi:hypothetical protein
VGQGRDDGLVAQRWKQTAIAAATAVPYNAWQETP